MTFRRYFLSRWGLIVLPVTTYREIKQLFCQIEGYSCISIFPCLPKKIFCVNCTFQLIVKRFPRCFIQGSCNNCPISLVHVSYTIIKLLYILNKLWQENIYMHINKSFGDTYKTFTCILAYFLIYNAVYYIALFLVYQTRAI